MRTRHLVSLAVLVLLTPTACSDDGTGTRDDAATDDAISSGDTGGGADGVEDTAAPDVVDDTATSGHVDGTSPDTESPAGTNSNACLAELGRLQPVCPADATGLPDAACCQAFVQFQENACGCSPFIATVMGTNAAGVSRRDQLVLGLNLLCPSLGVEVPVPDCESPRAPSGIATGLGHTYAGGTCPLTDAELDDLRFRSFALFQRFFVTFSDPALECVDMHSLQAELAPAFEPDAADGESPWVMVPYGIGKYKTIKGMVEYLAMSVPIVVKDMWRVHVDDQQTDDSMLYLAPDGSRIIGGNHGTVRAYGDCASSAEGYFESIAEFAGCNTAIHGVRVPVYSEAPSQLGKLTVMPHLIETIYKAFARTQAWGITDICKYHEAFCTEDNRQFDSYEDCLAFMRSLPLTSEACGNAGPLGGNSLGCRFKHHFMTPFDPSTHCFHIGPGHMDADGHVKCVDSECTTPATLGPPELLDTTPTEEESACLRAADDAVLDDGVPIDHWPKVAICPAR